MSGKHSPAPWRREETLSDYDPGLHIYDARGIWVGTARPWSQTPTSREEQQANADVMIASPLLLAACEAALPWLALATANPDLNTENAKADLLRLQLAITRAGGEPGRGIDEEARTAIQKARGEG